MYKNIPLIDNVLRFVQLKIQMFIEVWKFVYFPHFFKIVLNQLGSMLRMQVRMRK